MSFIDSTNKLDMGCELTLLNNIQANFHLHGVSVIQNNSKTVIDGNSITTKIGIPRNSGIMGSSVKIHLQPEQDCGDRDLVITFHKGDCYIKLEIADNSDKVELYRG